MRKLPARFLIALACALPVCVYAASPRLVGYVTPTAVPANIEAARMNAMIFAFAHIRKGEIVLDAAHVEAFHRLQTLRTRNPKLKLLISVGGWGAGGFSDAALSAASRHRFAASAVKLMCDQHADGLDIDWEYPGHHESGIQSRDSDRQHFTLLLQTVREAFDHAACANHPLPRHLLLTAALADGPYVDHVNLPVVAKSLDWINLMTYDFNNSLTPTTGNHAGLYRSAAAPPDARSTAGAVRQYLAAGVPARKLVIGAAFYGRVFTGVRDQRHGLYEPYAKSTKSPDWPTLQAKYIGHDGFHSYWDARAKAPYLWNRNTHTFVSYENPRSLRAKAAYVLKHHLGGIMYWEQSLDPDNVLFNALVRGLHPTLTAHADSH
jgi:chitinase